MGTANRRLKEARKHRHRVATAFKLLESGEITLENLLTRQDIKAHSLAKVDLWDVLRRAPNLGRKGAQKVCERAKVFPHTRMRELTDDERSRIIDALPPRARKRS